MVNWFACKEKWGQTTSADLKAMELSCMSNLWLNWVSMFFLFIFCLVPHPLQLNWVHQCWNIGGFSLWEFWMLWVLLLCILLGDNQLPLLTKLFNTSNSYSTLWDRVHYLPFLFLHRSWYLKTMLLVKWKNVATKSLIKFGQFFLEMIATRATLQEKKVWFRMV